MAIVTARKPRGRKATWTDGVGETPEEREGVPRPHDPAQRANALRRLKMIARPIPCRHWRSYGHEALPTGEEALAEPFAAFPSWFLRITCDRCGQQGMFSETHSAQGCMLIRDIIDRMRHDGCGGREGGAAHRHRGGKQTAGAADRADRRVTARME